MREANAKVNGEHKEFEAQLKARRKDFGELLESYAREVESYGMKNEIVKRDQIAGEVRVRQRDDGGAKCRDAFGSS
jgi:dynein heavy chain